MLKKIYRLSSVRLNNSKNINSTNFNIRTAKNDTGIPRFGFVISKRIDKRAVVRNSVKRKLSMSIEEIFDRISDGNDFVFYPKASIIEATRENISKEVEDLFQKEGFIK